MGEERFVAEVLNVVDGDTMDVRIDLRFDTYLVKRIRLADVDTPEIRGKEKVKGKKVKEIVKEKIEGKEVELISLVKADKFGRCLARIVIDGEDLAEFLLENGYAKPYHKKTIVKKLLSFLGFKKNES